MNPPRLKLKPDDANALRQRALGLLARREHSRAELQRKLTGPETDAAELGALIEHLATAGQQSDTRYAEAFVRSRIERGHGPVRIRQELRQRGVASDTAATALDEAEVDWSTQLAAVHRPRPVDRPRRSVNPWRLRCGGLPGDVHFLHHPGERA